MKVKSACLKYDLLLYFRQEHGKIQKKRQTLNAVDFDPRQPKDKTVNQGSLDKLTQALILANPTCGFVKYNTESGNTDRVRWKF